MLFERLIRYTEDGQPFDGERLSVHGFAGAYGEVERGHMTRMAFYKAFGLNRDEKKTCAALFDAGVTSVELHEVLLIGLDRVPGYAKPSEIAARFGV